MARRNLQGDIKVHIPDTVLQFVIKKKVKKRKNEKLRKLNKVKKVKKAKTR